MCDVFGEGSTADTVERSCSHPIPFTAAAASSTPAEQHASPLHQFSPGSVASLRSLSLSSPPRSLDCSLSCEDLTGHPQPQAPPALQRATSLPGKTPRQDMSLQRTSVPVVLTSQSIIIALVEHFCAVHEKEASRRQHLFQVLCQRLESLKVLLPVEQSMHEVNSVLSTSQQFLHDLFIGTLPSLASPESALSPDGLPTPDHAAFWFSAPRQLGEEQSSGFSHMHFVNNFIRIATIGHGGFGKVYRVRNVLDQREYAVKCVRLKHITPEKCLRAMREVKIIARFDHPNIVRYYSSWLEFEGPASAVVQPAYLGGQFTLPPSPPALPRHGARERWHGQNTNHRSRALPPAIVGGTADSSQHPSSAQSIDICFTDPDMCSSQLSRSEYSSTGSSSSPMSSSSGSQAGVAGTGYQSDDEDTTGGGTDECDMPPLLLPTRRLSTDHHGEIVINTRQMNRSHRFERASRTVAGSVGVGGGGGGGNEKYSTVICTDTVSLSNEIDGEVDASDIVSFAMDSSPKSESGAGQVMLYIQMQLCQYTLLEWLAHRNDPTIGDAVVDEVESWRLFMEVLVGIQHIHAEALIHRDLKPANIFLSGIEKQVKLGDFGLAREDVAVPEANGEQPMTPLSELNWSVANTNIRTENVLTCGVGTSTYASPEQLEGRAYNAKSDMFSLGLILLELFMPFSTSMERIRCIRDGRQGILPPGFASNFPKQAQLVRQLLAFLPCDRPDSHTLLKSIKQMQGDLTVKELQQQLSAKDKKIATMSNEMKHLTLLLQERDAKIAALTKPSQE